MPIEQLKHLNLSFDSSLREQKECEVWIDGRELKKLPIDDQLKSFRRKATLEILSNTFREINRTKLYERTIYKAKETITFLEIENLTILLDDEKLALMDYIAFSISDTLSRGIPRALEAKLKKTGIGKIRDEHDLLAFSRDPNFEGDILPLAKTVTCQCLKLKKKVSFDDLKTALHQNLTVLMAPNASLEEEEKQAECITTMTTLKQIWSTNPRHFWENITAAILQPAPPIKTEVLAQQSLAAMLLKTSTEAIASGLQTFESTLAEGIEAMPSRAIISTDSGAAEAQKALETKVPLKKPQAVKKVTATAQTSQTTWYTPIPQLSEPDTLPEVHRTAVVRPKIRMQTAGSSKKSEKKTPTLALTEQPPIAEQTQTTPITAFSEIPDTGLDFTSQTEFNCRVVQRTMEIHALYKQKEDFVWAYIKNPQNQEALAKAVAAVKCGPWISRTLYKLLLLAAQKTEGENNPFREWLDHLIEINAFHAGIPPMEISTGKAFLFIEPLSEQDGSILFCCSEGIEASDALMSFFTCFNIHDSNTATFLGLYCASYDFLGKFFNAFFTSEISDNLELTHDFRLGTLTRVFATKTKLPILIYAQRGQSSTPAMGSILIAHNHEKYEEKHTTKQDHKLMVICTTKQKKTVKFTAPGLFANYSEHEVDNKIVDLFNESQKTKETMNQTQWKSLPYAMRSKYNKWPSQPMTLTIKELAKKEGLNFDTPAQVNFTTLRGFKTEQLKTSQPHPKTPHQRKKDKKTKIKKSGITTKSPENLLKTLKKQCEKLTRLYQKKEFTSATEIAETTNKARELKQTLENENIGIPDELHKQVEEVLRVAEEIGKLSHLEQTRLKLHTLCKGDQAFQRGKEINQIINDINKEIKEVREETINISEKTQHQIDETISLAEETCRLALLEQKRLELKKVCEERTLNIPVIRMAVKSIRELKRKLNELDINIPEGLNTQVAESLDLAEDSQNIASLLEMQNKLQNLIRSAKKLHVQETEVMAAIENITTYIEYLRQEGTRIPEDVNKLVEQSIRDANKLTKQ